MTPALARLAERRPLVLLAFLALIIPGPGLLPDRAFSPCGLVAAGLAAPRSIQWDVALQAHPWLIHEARELRAGRVPLWNPWSLCGAPFIGNPQTAALSPFTLVAALLPLPFGIAVAAWLKLFIAGAGMYVWLRLLGLGGLPALAGAVPFMLNGFLVAGLRWPHTGVVLWLPWLFAAVERLRARPDAPAVAGLAAVTGLQFLGGHPPSSIHVLAATGAYAACRLPRTGRAGYAGGVALGYGAGALLAAPVLLPFLDYLSRSVVWEARRAGYDRSLPLRDAVAWLLPDYHGSPVRLPVWHRAGANPYDAAASPGAVAWTLAPAGVLAAARSRAGGWFLAALAIVAAVVALSVPGHALLVVLPPFSMLDGSRAGFLVALSVCGLAALAANDLLAGGVAARRARRLTVRTAVLLIAAIAGLVAVDADAITNAAAWRVAGGAAGLAAALGAATGWLAGRGRAGIATLVLLSAVDLLRFGVRWNEPAPAALFYPETPAVRMLRAWPHDRAIWSPVNVATAYGVREAGGFDSLTPRVIRDALGDARTGGPAGTGPLVPAQDPGDAALRRAAVRWYVAPAGARTPSGGSFARTELPGAVVFEDRRAPDRARVAGGTVTFEVDDPERVVLAVDTRAPSTLVLADTHDPGWRARIDGTRVPIRFADRAFRSVEVPAGRSSVEFRYIPIPFGLGCWLAGLAIGLMAASGMTRRRV